LKFAQAHPHHYKFPDYMSATFKTIVDLLHNHLRIILAEVEASTASAALASTSSAGAGRLASSPSNPSQPTTSDLSGNNEVEGPGKAMRETDLVRYVVD